MFSASDRECRAKLLVSNSDRIPDRMAGRIMLSNRRRLLRHKVAVHVVQKVVDIPHRHLEVLESKGVGKLQLAVESVHIHDASRGTERRFTGIAP